MKKAFFLKTCTTCTKIIKDLKLSDDWELREIKTNPISEAELDKMYALSQSYESLFSKRSTQIKSRGIDLNQLTESDYKNLILDHYSFLRRPIFLTDHQIFIGNSKENQQSFKTYLSSKD